ncbi:acetyltransferase [Bowmanella denitrificans]|uniref:Acetyltransferase n=1 Tax=Bowmanella denitrificans TaxID=366582 RepID=A0ABN0WYG2_9ALTE|nr:GNAT family N-acetyltransferase [Bowmanella denitrificans]
MYLGSVSRDDYPQLIQIWEASVRATHDFLSDADILKLKPLILEQYFDAVALTAARNEGGELLGFSGVAEGNLEMLFIAPEQRGLGVGTALCRHAIDQQGVSKVDVNEQNPQALGFYLHMGFVQIGRSELDGQGAPFPLLHLALA